MRSAKAAAAPSRNDALFVAALSALVVAQLSGADALVGSATLSLARDVGENCDPACVLAGLGAIFGAAALPTAAHRAESGWPGSRGDHTLPLGAPQEHAPLHPNVYHDEQHPHHYDGGVHATPKQTVDGLMRFYKVYKAASEFIGGKEKVTSLATSGKA